MLRIWIFFLLASFIVSVVTLTRIQVRLAGRAGLERIPALIIDQDLLDRYLHPSKSVAVDGDRRLPPVANRGDHLEDDSWCRLTSMWTSLPRGLTNVAADKHFSDAASPQWL